MSSSSNNLCNENESPIEFQRSKSDILASLKKEALPTPNLLTENPPKQLLLLITNIFRNWDVIQPEKTLILHVDVSRINFFNGTHQLKFDNILERDSNSLDSLFTDENKFLSIDFKDINFIRFYESKHGMFNTNPNEYAFHHITDLKYAQLDENIQHLRTFSSPYINASSISHFKPHKSVLDSSTPSKIKKFFRQYYKSKTTKKPIIVMDNTNSLSDVLSDSTIRLDSFSSNANKEIIQKSEICFLGIEYYDGTNHTVFYGKTHKKDAEQLHYFLTRKVIKKTHPFEDLQYYVKPKGDFIKSPRLTNTILKKPLFEKLSHFVTSNIMGCYHELVYSSSIDGFSLQTLYKRCEAEYEAPALLIVKESTGNVFGAYLSSSPHISSIYFYGDFSCCVFQYKKNKKLKVYRWAKELDYFLHCDSENMMIGSSKNDISKIYRKYVYIYLVLRNAIWLYYDLLIGRSTPCDTFMNKQLSDHETFKVSEIEVWQFLDAS